MSSNENTGARRNGAAAAGGAERTSRREGQSPTSGLDRHWAKRSLHHANFTCFAPQAQEVCLVGAFNDWNPRATPMARRADGWWSVDLELGQGYHEYFFAVDGQRELDPKATGKTRNAYVGWVSLRSVS